MSHDLPLHPLLHPLLDKGWTLVEGGRISLLEAKLIHAVFIRDGSYDIGVEIDGEILCLTRMFQHKLFGTKYYGAFVISQLSKKQKTHIDRSQIEGFGDFFEKYKDKIPASVVEGFYRILG